MKTKDKEKMVEALQPLKKFKVCMGERIYYEKTIEASSKDEATDMLYSGGIEFEEKDIVDVDTLDDSYEVIEEET